MRSILWMSFCLAPAAAAAWDGKVEFGGMASRGNSNLNQIRGALELRGSNADSSMELKLDGVRETSGVDDKVTAERAGVSATFNSKSTWTSGQYWFFSPVWRYNRLGYQVRTAEVFGGVGWQWSRAPAEMPRGVPLRSWRLSLESGPGWRAGRQSDGGRWHGPVFLLRLDGTTALTDALELEGDIAFETSERVTETISRLSLRDRLTQALSLRLNWHRYETRPVVNRKPVDSIVGVSLAYEF